MPLGSSKQIVVAVCIILLVAGILFAMGRTPWYKYGGPGLWSGDTTSDQNSQQLFDPYTFTHIIHGIGFYFLLWFFFREKLSPGARFLIALGIEGSWEIVENTDFVINRYREATISLDYYGDSILNTIGDMLACVVGYFLAARFSIWATISCVLILELALLFWIRDNLILNIIMLIYPFPGIKVWQGGG
ncbi:MAG: DUF2585 family protein [Patescibacteria group bacterium]